MMAFLRYLLAALFWVVSSGFFSLELQSKLRWSQFQRWASFNDGHSIMAEPIDPRVRAVSSAARGATASAAAKISGPNSDLHHNWVRKRAFRRARQRAIMQGGTWYRGVWRSARSLGVMPADGANTKPTEERTAPTLQGRRPRVRVLSYNVGGMSSDLYDVFVDWLKRQQCADIVLLQEIHHGLGRGESQWTRDGWHFLASASPDNRFAGVCICISAKLVKQEALDYQTWVAGRILHVRVYGNAFPIDVVSVYQWVEKPSSTDSNVQKRLSLWEKLNQLLASLPRRNILVLGCDLNTVLKPLGVHIGSGVQACRRAMDDALANIFQVHDLCVLNTWKSARPGACSTFHHGAVRTQIDFIITRRSTTDPQARSAGPVSLDLAPWRQGPKHWPVQASIPLIGPWILQRRAPKPMYSYSLRALRACPKENPDKWQVFCASVEQVIHDLPAPTVLARLNARVLAECRRFFPPENSRAHRHKHSSAVDGAIAQMWHAYKSWRRSRGRRALRGGLFKAWRQYAEFGAASRRLRKQSVQARKERIYAIIDRAASAAAKDQMNELYSITRAIAPRQRKEKVRIRASDGAMLAPHGQFQAIAGYFQQAFQAPTPFRFSTSAPAPCITVDILLPAILGLKPRKAVPANSIPPEVWKACAQPFASRLADAYTAGVHTCPSQLPQEITDCSLALLPKPGKAMRHPKDLRPIGIQDPASKLVARTLKNMLVPQVAHLMQCTPQFAYCEGKGIDQAIFRVISHCGRVRKRMNDGVLSVHARREGKTSSKCYGGIMVGIDMSRAFDTLARDVLLRSLQHAGVDASLQRILIEIHEACQYEISHMQYSTKVSMGTGVRQGCAVSPLLYSLFTAWFLAELETRTSASWVQHLVTCFADDTHLAWEIESFSDVAFFCTSLRATFQLLRECKMLVNSDKSTLVLGIRGTQAKSWIRKHLVVRAGRKCLDLGTPGAALCIPVADHLVYLGVVASYKGYENQALQHRLKAASANRSRLNKLLHSRQLHVRRRISLYVSCVRSSLLFGVYAVGLNEWSLRRLVAADSRHVRSIARSPAHLSHESNAALRNRLQIQGPLQDLIATMKRREAACSDVAFVQHLQDLGQWIQHSLKTPEDVDLPDDHGKLRWCGPAEGVACTVCGVYFTCMRTMKTHRTKMHGAQASKFPPTVSLTHTEHSKDGMPHCLHCDRKFTRVEALKKHLRGSCPVLHSRIVVQDVVPEQSKTESQSLACGAGDCEGPLGHACRALPAPLPEIETRPNVAEMPLMKRQTFRDQLRSGWRSVLSNPDSLRELQNHCAFCHQWVSLKGPGVKQHLRLSHNNAWRLKDDANSLCSSAGSVVASPCAYCGGTFQDPRTHIKRCPVAFQAALAHLCLVQEDGASGRGPHAGGGSPGDAGGLGGDNPTAPSRGLRNRNQPSGHRRRIRLRSARRNGTSQLTRAVKGRVRAGEVADGRPGNSLLRTSLWTMPLATCCTHL